MEKIPLTTADFEKIAEYKAHERQTGCVSLISSLLFILVYYYFSKGDPSGIVFFIAISIIFIIVMSFLYSMVTLKNETHKLVTTTKISEKTAASDDDGPYFKFEEKAIKKLDVTERIYKRFEEGDTIKLEITENTKKLLSIKKLHQPSQP